MTFKYSELAILMSRDTLQFKYFTGSDYKFIYVNITCFVIKEKYVVVVKVTDAEVKI